MPFVSLWLISYLSCFPDLFLFVQIFPCLRMAVNVTLAMPLFLPLPGNPETQQGEGYLFPPLSVTIVDAFPSLR